MRDRFCCAGLARRVFAVLLLLLGGLLQVEAGEKWVVTDNELTVWDSPEYLKKLGMVTCGYEIDAIAIEGDMIRFEYNGQTAYVATYCCARVPEKSAGQEQAAANAGAVEAAPAKPSSEAAAVSPKKVERVADAASGAGEADKQPSVSGYATLIGIPLLLLGIVFLLLGLAGIVFTACYAFCPKKLAAWFNERCGEDVIPAKRFNKLLLPPVYAGVGAVVSNILVFGIGSMVAVQMKETILSLPEEMHAAVTVVVAVIGLVVAQIVPFLILRHWYVKYHMEYGKKAARWMTIYSIMCLVAIYLICMFVIYALMAMFALLILLLVLCVCFPARYYVVRRW